MVNYPAVIAGFMEKGVPETDIRPRENVFTFHAWLALGRHVRKGEHGVRILTWIPIGEKRDEAGNVTHKAGKRPKTAVVFHVSQTEQTEVRS
jgi:antirestriction protein ArdC